MAAASGKDSAVSTTSPKSHTCEYGFNGANPAKTPEKRAKPTFPTRVALASYQRREWHAGRRTLAK
jgi:hypothetical protein